jgi:hypothetical protein
MKNLVEIYSNCAAGIEVNRTLREGHGTTAKAHKHPNVRQSGAGPLLSVINSTG